MRVCLIVPPVLFARQAPISIAYLAAYLKHRGHEVRAWDLNTEISISNDSDNQFWEKNSHCSDFFENNISLFKIWAEKILNFDPRIVGFSIWDTTEYFAIKMAEMLKERNKNILIVFGGFFCTLSKKEFILNDVVDAVVYGEGELTLADIVENYDHKKAIQGCFIKYNGEIKDCGPREEIGDLNKLPFPDLSCFPLEKYLCEYSPPISFSRGCDWKCSFCITNCQWRKLRVRSAENICNEIMCRLEEFPKLMTFQVCDPSINSDMNLLTNLCDFIIKNTIKAIFHGFAQIKPQMTPELLKKLRKAGFQAFVYGVESGSKIILNKMRRPYTPELAERVIKDTYNAGIEVILGFIVGFPGETEEDFRDTLSFIKRIKDHVTIISSPNECWVDSTYIASHPEEFGIIYRNNWEISDVGKKIRKERVKEVNDFVKSLGISLNFPTEERKRHSEKFIKRLSNFMETDELSKKPTIVFDWNLQYACNYRCPYCWFNGKWHQLAQQNRYPLLVDLLKFWKKLYERYGSVYIRLIGGEPFIYPNSTELIKELSQIHIISVTTNLSIDVDEFIRQVNCSNVEMISTFHPLFANFDRFIKRFLLLKENGIRVRLSYLAYPPQIKQIKYYVDKFNEQGIQLSLMTFWGEYNGINYPEGYTQEEKNIIMPYLGNREGEKYQLEPKKVRGELCRAGERYAIIKPDGSAYRCGGSTSQLIGNFFCDDFKLLDEPLPCESEFCPCNEWPYLLKEKIKE